MSRPLSPARQAAKDNLARLKKLCTLYWSLRQSPVFEDRLEYSQEDLQSSYSLSSGEANVLYAMLQEMP